MKTKSKSSARIATAVVWGFAALSASSFSMTVAATNVARTQSPQAAAPASSGPLTTPSNSGAVPRDRNLLANNSGFETPGAFGGGHGATTSIPGWEADYFSYDGFGVSDGDAAEGNRKLGLNHGGRITTAAADRALVQPGTVYTLGFDAKKSVEGNPEALIGFTPSILFYDAAGTLIWNAKGPDVEIGGPFGWEHFTVTRAAPAGAVKAGVQVILPRGNWPHEDTREGFVDNFSLVSVPETADSVTIRRAPLLIEPGKNVFVKVKYAAVQARDIIVRLLKHGSLVVGVMSPVGPGRGTVTWTFQAPMSAAEGNDYTWGVRIVPRGGGWNKPLDSKTISGVFQDLKVTGSGAVDADNPDFLYAGRWDRTVRKAPIMYWGGTQIYTRFAGTSVKARIATTDGEEYLGVIDGDDDHMVKFHILANAATIATGLPDGVHSLMIMKNTETSHPAVFQGLTLDAGKGLLRPEPLPSRRIEFYGDSITSGGIPDPVVPKPDPGKDGDYSGNFYRTYAGFTARELAADYRMISKGATGMSGSFVFNYTLPDYYNRLDFDGWRPEAAKLWDFAQWQPDAVVIAIGQNDLFRKPSDEAFDKAYAAFIGKVHEAYPMAEIFCTNTSMSGFAGGAMWERAILPLLPTDPKLHFQLFLPGQPHGGHPRLQDHKDMAFGNVEWNGLADWIGDVMGW